ncbi:hypothetical protein HKD37_04G010557 [Glycine soja]
MEEGEVKQSMFGCFQTILNKLRALGRSYGNYDYIDKILRITTLRALENLDYMSLLELIGILKGKSLALNVQKTKKESLPKQSSRGLSKALSKNKDGSRWKNSSKKVFKEKRDKDKSSIIFYKCKKPEHLKSEYINLENSKYKHKQYKSMGKKGLMST